MVGIEASCQPVTQNDHIPHVLHVFPSFGVGGLPLRTIRIMGHLGARCCHTIVALDGVVTASERMPQAVRAEVVPMVVDKRQPLKSLLSFRRFIKRARPDVLATYNWGAIEWAAANRIWPLCRHVHFEAGFGAEEATKQLRRRVFGRRWALRRSEQIVVPSHTLRRIATTVWRFPDERVLYIPDGIDVKRYADAAERNSAAARQTDGIVIGTLAPLRPEKNVGRLLQAFARLDTKVARRLVIAGDGAERGKLEKMVAEYGIQRRVTFLGHVSQPETTLPSFDIFALSSDTEQIPNAMLEAMAAGLPVAAVDVGDVKSMLPPENQDFVVPRDDLDAFAVALQRLTENSELRRQLGSLNQNHVGAHYRQETMFAAYERLLLV